MSDDIVARLRESDGGYFMRQMFTEAADEIERLRQLSGDAGQLRAERDAARAEICLLRTGPTSASEDATRSLVEYAQSRGWNDLFREETDGTS